MDIEKIRSLGHFDEKHRRQALFSMDYCLSHDKLVVAGLDSSLSFWTNIFKEPKKLATIIRHDGAVLCVRWAPSSIFTKFQELPILASGADDSVVMIWQQDSHCNSGNLDDRENLENYRVVKRLSGFHSADITGIEWSVNGKFLASCSIDGTVCVYDVEQGFSLMSRLDDHRASVKGISWDPASNMLLTQGEDKQTLLYRLIDGAWALETSVEEPLSNSTFVDSLFARNSWSYDGKFFAVANGSNGLIPAAVICETQEPSNQISLMGHLCAVEIVKFCPWPVESNKENIYLVAVASQDGWISIWNSSVERPLVVLSELFDHAIMDIVWFHNSQKELGILACSYDGYVMRLILEPACFGSGGSNFTERTTDKQLCEYTPDKLMSIVFEVRTNRVEPNHQLNRPIEATNGKKRIVPTLLSGGSSISSPVAPSVSTSIEVKISGSSSKIFFKEHPKGCLVTALKKDSYSLIFELQSVREGQYLIIAMNASKTRLWEEKISCFLQPCFIDANDRYVIVSFENGRIYTFSIHSGRRILPIISMTSSLSGLCSEKDLLFVIDVCGNYCLWDVRYKNLVSKGLIQEESNQGLILNICFISQSIVKIKTHQSVITINLSNNLHCVEKRPDYLNFFSSLQEVKSLPTSNSIPDIENTLAYALATKDYHFVFATTQHCLKFMTGPNHIVRLEELYNEIDGIESESLTACKNAIQHALSKKGLPINFLTDNS